MGRPTTKTDLLEAASNTYKELMEFIDSMTEKELATPFDFEGQASKKKLIGKEIRTLEIYWFICMNGISYYLIG